MRARQPCPHKALTASGQCPACLADQRDAAEAEVERLEAKLEEGGRNYIKDVGGLKAEVERLRKLLRGTTKALERWGDASEAYFKAREALNGKESP